MKISSHAFVRLSANKTQQEQSPHKPSSTLSTHVQDKVELSNVAKRPQFGPDATNYHRRPTRPHPIVPSQLAPETPSLSSRVGLTTSTGVKSIGKVADKVVDKKVEEPVTEQPLPHLAGSILINYMQHTKPEILKVVKEFEAWSDRMQAAGQGTGELGREEFERFMNQNEEAEKVSKANSTFFEHLFNHIDLLGSNIFKLELKAYLD